MSISAEVKDVIAEAAKAGVTVAAILGILAAVLPAAHFPAQDTAIVSAAAAAVSAFVKWAKDNKLASSVGRFLRG